MLLNSRANLVNQQICQGGYYGQATAARCALGANQAFAAARTRQAERRPTASFRSCGAHGDSLRIENGLSVGISSAGVGLRMRHDVLATTPRLARGWCLEADMEATFGRIGIGRPNRLVNIRDRQLLRASSFWGAKTGPNPTDRGKNGSKRHLMVDGSGTPLAITHTGANCHDSEMAIPLVNAVPPIKQPRGAPRKRPDELLADRAYDAEAKIRKPLRKRRIKPLQHRARQRPGQIPLRR